MATHKISSVSQQYSSTSGDMYYRTRFDTGRLVMADLTNDARKYTPQNYVADWSASDALLTNVALANASNDGYPASSLDK